MWSGFRIGVLILFISLAACGKSNSFQVDQQGPADSGDGNSPAGNPDDLPFMPVVDDASIAAARWEKSRGDSRAWTVYAFHALDAFGPGLLSQTPSDIADYCSNYRNLDIVNKKNFWVYFISSVTQFESAFDPTNVYQESFNNGAGEAVLSVGLLQLSIEDARPYKCSEIQTSADLKDPLKNLACGIRIFNRWISGDGVIRSNAGGWKGAARYWSTIRNTSPNTSIRSYTQAQTYCK